jgi:hypothetical protein
MRKIKKFALDVTLLGLEVLALFVFAVIVQPSLNTTLVFRTGLYDQRAGARQHVYNLNWHMESEASLPMVPSAANATKLFSSRLDVGGNGYTSYPIAAAASPIEMTLTFNFKDTTSIPVHFVVPDLSGAINSARAARAALSSLGGALSN